VLSQVIDTVMINFIFWMWTAASDPHSFLGQKTSSERYAWVFAKIGREYLIKLIVAILLTRSVVTALHSHMLGVASDYRNDGIGRRLKLRQREDALERGLDLMEWTFDPLELKNAYFNPRAT